MGGKESEFSLEILKDGSSFVSEVKIGSSTDMRYGIETVEINGCLKPREDRKTSLNLHFHPSTYGEPIIPSPNDLGDSTIFSGIAQVLENDRDINILLFRKHKFISSSEVPDNANSFWEQVEKTGYLQEDVQKALDENGFESFLISLKQRGQKFGLTKQSKEILKKINSIKVQQFQGY